MNPTDEQLAVLACDITRRPKGAPSFDDVLPALHDLRREAGALVLDFDPAARATVAALVDAERRCCPDIGWDLRLDPAPRLRISAAPEQLDVFEGFLRQPAG